VALDADANTAATGGAANTAATGGAANTAATGGAASTAATGDAAIGAAGAAVDTLVVTSREDLEVARLTRAALDARV